MPADASIYSLIRPAATQPGPLDSYAQGLQIKQLMGQGDLQALQRQQLERGIREEEATAEAYRESDGDPTKLRDRLYRKGLYKSAMAAEKNALETRKTRTEIEAKEAELRAKSMAMVGGAFANLAQNPTHEGIIKTLDDLKATGAIQGEGYQSLLSRIPSDPAQLSAFVNVVVTRTEHGLRALEARNPKVTMVDSGQQITPTNTNALAGPIGPIAGAAVTQRVTTPGEILTDTRTRDEGRLNRGVTIRGQNLVDDRAREAAGRDKYGPATEVTGPDGKPRLVVQNKGTGEFVDANTRQPVPGIGPKVGETAQKQQIGVQNTRSAITEYREALKNFGVADVANPNARARMGTVYNNMLLQAKEAFNLGVLNGPDYKILQEVITNPASWTGTITSKQALDDQAKKLEEIMGRIGQQITTTQAGVQTPQQSAGRIKFLGME